MNESRGHPLFISDLCRGSGVSERTLRNIFWEHFGVGPIRLLKLRQLHEIRAALFAADPTRHTVKSVASRIGVWDLTLFTRSYHALYAELPSETLRTMSDSTESCARPGITWSDYASRRFTSIREDCLKVE
jgi:AraC-like DNA-binding protein